MLVKNSLVDTCNAEFFTVLFLLAVLYNRVHVKHKYRSFDEEGQWGQKNQEGEMESL